MEFLRIAWRDISSIFKNRFIRVSVTAIIIVPLLYSLLYLAAFWDPYSKLKDMPVAVVNLDKGGIKDGKNVSYGNDIIDNLKKNDKLGWRFVSKEDADKGVKGKKYYAEFIIPENFSKDILSAKDGKPVQPKIQFTANEKRNFLAAQINGKVELELKGEIEKNITEEYTKVTFDNLYEVKDGFKKAADGSKDLNEGTVSAKDGSEKLKNGIAELNDKVPDLVTGVDKIYKGSGDLNGGLSQAQYGTAKLYDGSVQLNLGLATLMSKTPDLGNGVGQLYKGSGDLRVGLNSANQGLVSQLIPGAYKLKEGMAQLAAGLQKAKDAPTVLNAGISGLNQGVTGLTAGATKLNDVATALKGGSDKLQQVSPGLVSLNNGIKQVSSGVDSLITGVNASQTTLQNSVDTELMAYLKANPQAMKDPNMQKFLASLNTLKANATDPKNVAQIQALQKGVHDAASGAEQLAAGAQGIGQFAQGAGQFAQGATQFSQGANQFAQGAGQFAQGAGQLATGLSDAVKGSQDLSSGANTLYAGLNGDFASGLNKLNQGSLALNNGLGEVNTNVPALAGGIKQLYDGSVQLMNGLGNSEDRAKISGISQVSNGNGGTLLGGVNKLYDGSNQLRDGLGTLNSNVPALADGVSKLYDGSNQLYDGEVKLADGSKELNDKLKEGSDKLNKNLVNSSEDMGKFVSEPVTVDEKPINPVKNYGTGFAPYFLPLSLWVGALMMFFIITDSVDDDIKKKASSASIVAGKFLSYGFIGILQAVLASFVVLLLGLKPNNIVLYFVFNIFMSYVFIAIIQSLVFLLGEAGRLLSIVLLILQLTACAGTFPLEVVPPMFKALNPIMPFTYCVSALRELISGTDYVVLSQDVTVLACIMFGFLFISIIMKGHADKVQSIIEDRKTEVQLKTLEEQQKREAALRSFVE